MLKDDAPTYVIARSKAGKPFHLSTDGRFTLCGWRVRRDNWECHDERVALFTVMIADVDLCRGCKARATEERNR